MSDPVVRYIMMIVAVFAGAVVLWGVYWLGGRVERRRRIAAEKRALRCEETLAHRIFREAVHALDRLDAAEGRAALNPSPPRARP